MMKDSWQSSLRIVIFYVYFDVDRFYFDFYNFDFEGFDFTRYHFE